jgi:phosphatidylglycerophosphate synthase
MPEEPPNPSRRPLKSRSTAWARALSSALVARKVSPNAVSVFGVFASIVGAVAMLVAGRFLPVWLGLFIGAACVQIRLLCNLMDGLVAVEGGLKSKAGDLFNEAPDRIEDIVLLVGAGYACGQGDLGWACATLAVCTAYVRAFGASLSLGQDFRGPGAKPHRMAALTVGLLGAMVCSIFSIGVPVLAVALWVIAILTGVTFVRRTARIYQRLP